MNHADFVHLRVHTAYSLTEGAIRVEQLAGLCVRHRMPAVAITDTNNLFGALEGSKALAGKGIQPIIGCQISLARLDQQTAFGKTLRKPDPDRIVLLAQNEAGYANLMRPSTARKRVAEGKSGSVRLGIGGRRIIYKKKTKD